MYIVRALVQLAAAGKRPWKKSFPLNRVSKIHSENLNAIEFIWIMTTADVRVQHYIVAVLRSWVTPAQAHLASSMKGPHWFWPIMIEPGPSCTVRIQPTILHTPNLSGWRLGQFYLRGGSGGCEHCDSLHVHLYCLRNVASLQAT